MKRKRMAKRVVSGCLALISFLSMALSPAVAYAAEPASEKIPYYEEIKDQLDPDEVVTANDYEITIGSSFDITSDFSGIEIPDDSKVKVTFHDAENENGDSFSTDHEDTYQAVYYVEPQTTGHPVYQISRNILVKEVQTEAESTANTDSSSDDDSGNGEASDSEEELTDTESDQVGQTEAEDVPDNSP